MTVEPFDDLDGELDKARNKCILLEIITNNKLDLAKYNEISEGWKNNSRTKFVPDGHNNRQLKATASPSVTEAERPCIHQTRRSSPRYSVNQESARCTPALDEGMIGVIWHPFVRR